MYDMCVESETKCQKLHNQIKIYLSEFCLVSIPVQ